MLYSTVIGLSQLVNVVSSSKLARQWVGIQAWTVMDAVSGAWVPCTWGQALRCMSVRRARHSVFVAKALYTYVLVLPSLLIEVNRYARFCCSSVMTTRCCEIMMLMMSEQHGYDLFSSFCLHDNGVICASAGIARVCVKPDIRHL